jgi:CDP-paratose synthetase
MQSETPVDMTAGEQILDFTHVNDLAAFYVHILQNPDTFCSLDNGEEFHIGTGKGTTIRELVSIVERIYGRKCNINFGGRPYRERDTMHAVAPIAKNLSLVRWRAMISLEEGIRMMKEANG